MLWRERFRRGGITREAFAGQFLEMTAVKVVIKEERRSGRLVRRQLTGG